MKKITYNSTSNGFTLLEMLFALIIFSFALVSLMTIAGRGVITTTNAKEQLTVQYLAEELIEVARNERDTGFLNQDSRDSVMNMLYDECQTACDIDYSDSMPILQSCDTTCGSLYVNNEYAIFSPEQKGESQLSQYKRELKITPVGENPNELKLEATVYWNQRGVNRSYTLTTHLVNWMLPYYAQ